MLLFAVLSFGILALGPQVVRSLDFTFQLSEVRQCEPVSLNFSGTSTARAIPMWLTLVPFNSSPVSVPIPNASANILGVYVTFVPFTAGTTFVASLDNVLGENVAKVSDVIRVLPSPTGNTTCLPAIQHPAPSNNFTLDNSTFLQCETFSLKYNQRVISQAPSVRLYNPEGSSRLLNITTDDSNSGTANYLLSAERGKEVVLVVSDGANHQESTALMTVGGDSSSSEGCLGNKGPNGGKSKSDEKSSGVSQTVIIGSSVGGGVIFLTSVCLLLFILRERRRRRPERSEFDSVLLEKGRTPTPMSKARSPSPKSLFQEKSLSAGYVKDPPYTAAKFLSSTTTYSPRESMASWAQPTPADQMFPKQAQRVLHGSPQNNDQLTIDSLDIEGMLNLAMVQSRRSSRSQLTAEPIQALQPIAYSPRLTVPETLTPRNHSRGPSDIPVGVLSVNSAFTLNSVVDPFVDNIPKQDSTPRPVEGRQVDPIVKPPKVTLPSSPRSAPRVVRERSLDSGEMWQNMIAPSSNRSSRGSMGDHYGVAQ